VAKALKARGRFRSRLEVEVAAVLEIAQIPYESEVEIDGMWVDFRVGKTVIEVDGAYWHDPSKDAVRDATLRKQGYRVVRVTEREVKTDAFGALLRALI
jgi:very-short-patch-repair endonuclease